MSLLKDDYILALDVSTSKIGISLIEYRGEGDKPYKLIELTHIKLKSKKETLIEQLHDKAKMFAEFIKQYVPFKVKYVVIEEPLLQSNNVYTASTLLRFNGMISMKCDDVFGVVPDFISSYEARAKAFPDLMAVRKVNKKGEDIPEKKWGNPVLFGAYPFDVDKKKIIFEKVANLEPQIVWLYDKKGKVKEENFDMSDSYAVGLSFINSKLTP